MILQISTEASLVPTAKFCPPTPGKHTLVRKRLFNQLEKSTEHRFTLVCAPAGYGKSTAVAAWCQQTNRRVVWVSLDDADNDYHRFWGVILEAISNQHPGAPYLRYASLRISPASRATDDTPLPILSLFFQEYPQNLTLILDDYQVIYNTKIHQSVEHLLRHAPRQFHLVISTRTNPPFSIHRLRLQGEAIEINLEDLKFQPDEITDLYKGGLNKQLPNDFILGIGLRTEGWVLGLQAAMLALRNERNAGTVTNGLGAIREWMDSFFTDEVLRSHSAYVEQFLVQTSILDEMSSSLCEAVTENPHTCEILHQLVTTNSFVSFANNSRTWYRYHPLFSDFLRNRLIQIYGNEAGTYHRRAAVWYSHHNLPARAIGQAIEGQDFEFAAQLLENESANLLREEDLGVLLDWLARIPETIMKRFPRTIVLYGFALALADKLSLAAQKAAKAEEAVAARPSNTTHSAKLAADVDSLKGLIAILQQDADITLNVMALSKQSSVISDFYATSVRLNRSDACLLHSRIGQNGRLRRAFHLYQELSQVWKDSCTSILGYSVTVLGELHYERNELDELLDVIPKSLELGHTFHDLGILVPAYLLHAQYFRARKMSQEMWLAVHTLENEIPDDPKSEHWKQAVDAYKARLWIEENNAKGVTDWVNSRKHLQGEPVTVATEFELITLARAFLFQKQWQNAGRLVAKLVFFAEASGRLASRIELLLLQTILWSKQRDDERAAAAVREAVKSASPEGYCRAFLDEGEIITKWLHQLIEPENDLEPAEATYIKSLLRATDSRNTHDFLSRASKHPTEPLFVEPLTHREQCMIELINRGLSNAEIAKQLDLTIGTVKGYVYHAFSKLGVKNRVQAVARAKELQLLPKD